MAKSIVIIPNEKSGQFVIKRKDTAPFGYVVLCEDADAVGENIETAIWPLIKSSLEARKKITITITEG